MDQGKQVLMQEEELQRTISRMAHEIGERNGGVEDLALIGIRSRGAHLVRRIARKIEEWNGNAPPVGVIDITPYRDDVERGEQAQELPAREAWGSVGEKTETLV